MSQFPSLPLFTDAYIADTTHLTNEEHGAYLRLLMFAWRAPLCRLPDDDARLARMLGLTAKKWASIKPVVMAFWTLDSGFWTQKRLAREHRFVSEKVEKKRAAGSLGGRPKSLENNDQAEASGSENGKQNQSEPKAPTPTPTPTERISPLAPSDEAAEDPAPDEGDGKVTPLRRIGPSSAEVDIAFERFWRTYPKRHGSNPRKLAVERFAKAVKRGSKPEAIIAGARGYAGLMGRTGKLGTEFVQQAAVWLNREGWLDDYEPTAPPADKWHMV